MSDQIGVNTSSGQNVEKFEFQEGALQLFDLIIKGFYPCKEFFIRELICNAIDALNKVRYMSLTDPSVLGEGEDLHIKIEADRTNSTLSFIDNGIGMTKMDLINNLGSVTHSGTRNFKEQLSPDSDIYLNGQYGMGFYSALMVADRIQVISKHKDDEQFMWEYAGGNSYTVSPYNQEQLGRGTKVILHIKEGEGNVLVASMVALLMDFFFEFINYPITLEDIGVEQSSSSDYLKYKRRKPLWMYEPEEVEEEDYKKLLGWMTLNETSSYLLVKHIKYKGLISFRALIFVPRVGPVDFSLVCKPPKVRLFSQRIQITQCSEDLLPEFMNFASVIVDSDNVLLNANRSDFHDLKEKQLISEVLTDNVFEILNEIVKKPETFNEFHKYYSESIKLGVKTDKKYFHRLLPFMSFYTLKNGHKATLLKDYVTKMKQDQQVIYYLVGEDLKILSNSPLLENFKKRDLDVILMNTKIDQSIVDMIVSYDNKELVDVSATNLEMLNDLEQKENDKRISSEFESTCKSIKKILANEVEDVVVSNKISYTPCCISTSTEDASLNRVSILKSPGRGDSSSTKKPASKKYFEINPKDPIINRLKKMLDQGESPNTSSKNIVNMLYSAALLRSGKTLERPHSFTKLMYSFVNMCLKEQKEIKVATKELLNENRSPKEFSLGINHCPKIVRKEKKISWSPLHYSDAGSTKSEGSRIFTDTALNRNFEKASAWSCISLVKWILKASIHLLKTSE
ncbi:hypothetical protein Aperf_G00000066122 [Anoplocephala perfoliata]